MSTSICGLCGARVSGDFTSHALACLKAHEPKAESNEPARAGQLASGAIFIKLRYRVAAVHTRFAAVQWFAWDLQKEEAVVRQAETFAGALVGL